MLQPRELPDYVQQARTAMQVQGNAGARAVVAQLCAAHPDDDLLFALNAQITLWTDGYMQAYEMIQKRLLGRKSASLYGIAAEIAQFMADNDRQTDYLARAQEIDPDDLMLLRTQIGVCSMGGQFARAIELADRYLELYPKDPDGMNLKLGAYNAQGDTKSASAILDNPPDWYRDTAQFYSAKGQLAFRLHDLVSAEKHHRNSVACCPQGAYYWSNLALVQTYLEHFDDAAVSAHNALDLAPNSMLALQAMSRVAKRKGNPAAAEEYKRRMDEAVPALKHNALLRKASEFNMKNKVSAAAAIYTDISHNGPSFTARVARHLMVGMYLQHEKWQQAETALTEAVAIDGLTDDLRTCKLRILVHQGDTDAASSELAFLIDRPTPHPSAIPWAIGHLLDINQSERAQRLIDYTITEMPGIAADIANTIMALIQHNMSDQARLVHAAALRRYPDNPTLKLITVGFAAHDGNMNQLPYLIRQLPPEMRQKLLPKRPIWSIAFWKRLAYTVKRLFGGKPRA